MRKLLIGAAAAAAIVAGGAVYAQTVQLVPAAPRGHLAHKMQPATRAEFQSHVATTFAKLDANRDGFISEDELNARENLREQRAEKRAEQFDPSKMFDRMDSNHDGKVTTAEAEAARSQHAKGKPGKPANAHATAIGGLFARADTNKDGVITRGEFDTVGQQMKARMEHAGMRGGGMAGHMFGAADANKDDRVSLAEMQQAALARFDRLDLNHDGTISAEERQQARQARKAQRHKD
ncbi:MAG TPA: EF-hand domain-containing protein [Sphingomicrobium sp.]